VSGNPTPADGLEYIRDHYGVPAYEGGMVEYGGHDDSPIVGRIVGSDNARLLVDFGALTRDGSAVLHPTWRVTYLEPEVCSWAPMCSRPAGHDGKHSLSLDQLEPVDQDNARRLAAEESGHGRTQP
jgi:hypothetical protein